MSASAEKRKIAPLKTPSDLPTNAITDISAMVYDRLAVGKPILVTRPASADAEVDEQGYLGSAEWLRVEDAPRVLTEVDRVLNDESARSTLAFWSAHHFGDTTPGASTARFHAAVERLVWDFYWRSGCCRRVRRR